MPKRAKPRKSSAHDREKWAVESDVAVSTMDKVLRGGDPTMGRASARAYRYLESHGLLDFIEPNKEPEVTQ